MFPSITSLNPTVISSLAGKTTQLQRQPESVKAQNDKIDKSAKDFESLLVTNWLQGAQEGFASVPGGNADEDEDPGHGQLQGFAMQSLGTALTAAGGIGIAHSIAQLLHKSDTPAPTPNTISKISSIPS
jgi:Rod binding domain-containing protein